MIGHVVRQATDPVLRTLAGYTADEIRRLDAGFTAEATPMAYLAMAKNHKISGAVREEYASYSLDA